MSPLAIVAGLATGLMLGLFGSGGSIVTLPALIYLLGVETKPAIAMSLGIVSVTAAISAVTHWRRGNINVPVAVVFGLFGMLGTYGGARLGVMTPELVQLGSTPKQPHDPAFGVRWCSSTLDGSRSR
ncbi:MAG: sulfite exporter TauE/SafE family protein [Magnetospirillum sp.]|nr:sulfite exporter TauE/SafE family protein [Magnetospirillum sp.]